MAKSKSFNAAEDLLFGTNAGNARQAEKTEEKTTAASSVRKESRERSEQAVAEQKTADQPNQPVGDKLFFIHKEAKSVRKNWLITPSNDRDLRAEAQSLGISVNELINLIFEQRYGRTRG